MIELSPEDMAILNNRSVATRTASSQERIGQWDAWLMLLGLDHAVTDATACIAFKHESGSPPLPTSPRPTAGALCCSGG